MLSNRSCPSATVIPVLAYPDVNRAAAWLAAAFGFSVRLRIGTHHRIQMNVGDGAIVLREMRPDESMEMLRAGHSVTVRVEDVDAHALHAKTHGATISLGPETYAYGERQVHILDLAGHPWVFSQTVVDTDPSDWGAVAEHL